MRVYLFETNQFGISEQGFHLLRSRYNYQTINYQDIKELIIKKCRINNWFILFLLGLAFFAGASVYGLRLLYEFFLGNSVRVFYLEQFIILVFPLMLGSYMVYNSLKTRINIRIVFGNKSKLFSIEELQQQEELTNFIEYLRNNPATQNKLNIKDRQTGIQSILLGRS